MWQHMHTGVRVWQHMHTGVRDCGCGSICMQVCGCAGVAAYACRCAGVAGSSADSTCMLVKQVGGCNSYCAETGQGRCACVCVWGGGGRGGRIQMSLCIVQEHCGSNQACPSPPRHTETQTHTDRAPSPLQAPPTASACALLEHPPAPPTATACARAPPSPSHCRHMRVSPPPPTPATDPLLQPVAPGSHVTPGPRLSCLVTPAQPASPCYIIL